LALGTKVAAIDDIKDFNWSSDAVVEALEREEREIESNIPDREIGSQGKGGQCGVTM
jgi:hypothetical protein